MPHPAIRIALAAVVVSVFLSPFSRDLFVGDETKYGEVVREMRSTQTFFLPVLDGHPFTHKPPLHFWLIDALTFPLGVYSTWAFVLPSIAAFVFLLWLMYRMGGPLAAFLCGTSLLVWASAQTARMDVGFTAFIVLGAWMMQRFLDGGVSGVGSRVSGEIPAGASPDTRHPTPDTRHLLCSALAIAIATLIKGPMAPVIILVLFALEWWRRRRVPRGNYLPALAALVVIPLLWVVPAIIIGGSNYAHEIVVKQTVGRAVGAWVHRFPPWYYLLHMPGILLPWFFLLLVALWRGPRNRFYINWILAVLVPYSLMSSKLDVYMMALVPPVALLIADYLQQAEGDWRAKAANAAMVVPLMLGPVVPLVMPSLQIRGDDHGLIHRADVRGLFAVIAIAGLVALIIIFLRSVSAGTVATGLLFIVAGAYAAVALLPMGNDLASTRPLIAALQRQHVPAEQIALYSCPYLWSREFPLELERVHYVGPHVVSDLRPVVIATSRRHASEIEGLGSYHLVDTIEMIGKPFDVYRR